MAEQKLTDIFNKIKAGSPVRDWSGQDYGELAVVRQHEPDDRMWVRRPEGKWTEVPAAGEGANAAERGTDGEQEVPNLGAQLGKSGKKA